VLVRFCVPPSLYVPVAAYTRVCPAATDAFDGVTAIDTSTAGVTVKVPEPVTFPTVAPTVALPTPRPVATPPALIVATPAADVLQDAAAVKFCVLPSLYVPVAAYACVRPAATNALAGVTPIDTKTGAVTVSAAVPVTVPDAAVMVVFPSTIPLATPVDATAAIEGADELHVTVEVTF